VRHVHGNWRKAQGALKIVSWTAHRERVLFGARRRSGLGGGHGWPGDSDGFTDGGLGGGGDEGGSAGVREPRRPKSGPPSMGSVLPLPETVRVSDLTDGQEPRTG
jgi:hypothetical protein